MNDLIDFLTARLDDDERVARAASADGSDSYGTWRSEHIDGGGRAKIRDAERFCVIHDDGEFDGATADHIALHDPARVLREVEAKRRILDLHGCAGRKVGEGYPADGFAWCATCGSGEEHEYPTPWPCVTLRLLALPHADHPGYREEWHPDK